MKEEQEEQYDDGTPRNAPDAPGVSSAGSSAAALNTASTLGGRFDIAKLLDAVVKYNASDLHLRVNRPPCVRVRGELRNLGTTNLTPDDTVSLMKSVASERSQQELGE